MSKSEQPEKLLCPVCGKRRDVTDTQLLEAEMELMATAWMDPRRPPGWSVEAAQAGQLQWACVVCFKAGRALQGHPVHQTWCDHDPYFAFIDTELRCTDCEKNFVFSAGEQQFWYETLKFWVQSRPKQCITCRRARRERSRAARDEQTRRQQNRPT